MGIGTLWCRQDRDIISVPLMRNSYLSIQLNAVNIRVHICPQKLAGRMLDWLQQAVGVFWRREGRDISSTPLVHNGFRRVFARVR